MHRTRPRCPLHSADPCRRERPYAVLYALLIGQLLYGGIGGRKLYAMLVETAALSGAILLILGTASVAVGDVGCAPRG